MLGDEFPVLRATWPALFTMAMRGIFIGVSIALSWLGKNGIAALPVSGLALMKEKSMQEAMSVQREERHPFGMFLEGMGEKTWHGAGGVWAAGGMFSLYAEPTAAGVEVGRGEMERLLRASGRLVALAVVPRPTGREVATYWLRDREYGMHSLQRQFRQQVRRAAERCEVRRVTWEELGARSAAIHEGLARRGRDGMGLRDPARRERFWRAAAAVPGFEAWGVFSDGDLVAYLTVLCWRGCAYGMHMHWGGMHGEKRPTHLLYYETARAMMADPAVAAFTTGRQTVPACAELDRFKRHAGFIVEMKPLAVVMHPRWRLFLRMLPVRWLAMGVRWIPMLSRGEVIAAARDIEQDGRF